MLNQIISRFQHGVASKPADNVLIRNKRNTNA